jgi:hypothetical protein
MSSTKRLQQNLKFSKRQNVTYKNIKQFFPLRYKEHSKAELPVAYAYRQRVEVRQLTFILLNYPNFKGYDYFKVKSNTYIDNLLLQRSALLSHNTTNKLRNLWITKY